MPLPGQPLLELDLESLLRLTVSVAARSEPLSDAPVLVSRMDAAEARQLGARTLANGSLATRCDRAGQRHWHRAVIRGLVEGWNQKVLFLLVGVPYWQPTRGDFRWPLFHCPDRPRQGKSSATPVASSTAPMPPPA
jgi:hypothetical protein